MMALKVLKKELKENLRKKRIALLAILMAAVSMSAILLISILLSSILSSAGPMPDAGVITTIIIVVFPVFIVFPMMRAVFNDVVFEEKVKKGYENLLATPISLNDLVLGKALFIFLYTYSLILLFMLLLLGALSIDKIAYPLLYSLAYLLVFLPVIVLAIMVILVSVTIQRRAGQQILQALVFFAIVATAGPFYVLPYIFPLIKGLPSPVISLIEGLPYPVVFAIPLFGLAMILAAGASIMLLNADKEKVILTG